MSASEVEFAEIDPQSPAARAVVQRYFDELGRRFEEGFDPDSYSRAAPPAAAAVFVLGSRSGHPVACGALQQIAPEVAEIKRMWVDPESRGLGLGKRLLTDLEQRAVRCGWHTVRLDTNSALDEAISLYERSGYRRIDRYNDNPYAHLWFEKHVG